MIRALLLLCLTATALAEEAGGHVVGGSNTNIADHNHQLSLRSLGSHSCGASLVRTNRGVTAAHCGGSAISRYSILAGCTDRSCNNGQTRDLTEFVQHGSFSNTGATGYPNDIAVIKWTLGLSLGSSVGTITMASSGNFAGQTCTITGWGRTCGSCSLPETLQQGQMTVMTNAACESAWSAIQINDGHVCLSSNSVSACSGDSGGPLVCGNTLVGATSWGLATCEAGTPSVYTRISYFYTWINNNL